MTRADKNGWTPELDAKLRELVSAGQMFNVEIAKAMGKNPGSVGWRIRKLGLQPARDRLSHRLGQWNIKHKGIREEAMRYFLTHTAEETRKQFGLTESQFKSLMTVGYRTPQLKHLRKETRDHSPWSTEQLIFLLRHTGLRPRKWIVSKLGRGKSIHVVKDRLRALGIASRTLQGITLSQYEEAFGHRPGFYLQTSCGPDRGTGFHGKAHTHWKIVPWVYMDWEIRQRRLKTSEEFKLVVNTMAIFQRWIFPEDPLLTMQRICRQGRKEKA